MCQVQLRCFGDAWLSTSFSFQEFGSTSDYVQTRTCGDETRSESDRWNMPGYPRPDERKNMPDKKLETSEIFMQRSICAAPVAHLPHILAKERTWNAKEMTVWASRRLFWRFSWSVTACTENRVLRKEETAGMMVKDLSCGVCLELKLKQMRKLSTGVNFNLSTVYFQSSREIIKSFPALMGNC